eukprot:CAMPEP_0185596204 /NCGR_PEP_ID=MMETSP0434-20130131/80621_1 /TAXON_ID=626734 ORGANISM="Favella taraikaensis, Strain Fe Narragansett Bay" /NCGR_SAMPLE_ID=MMETSP0434 /ASSEMBLY_ACC=CAM_ASM_000379 /LENGTH=98 /DNA_ID=CAMNT_0028224673 /DNA_START=744 /DNA_END=1040 /DNA_ORIENTATION=+
MRWRTEPIDVEKSLDELWVGVKGQSNREIARSPRNAFRCSLGVEYIGGRATDRARGLHRLPTPDKLRMLSNIHGSEGMGAKVHVREGKNPTWFNCFDS